MAEEGEQIGLQAMLNHMQQQQEEYRRQQEHQREEHNQLIQALLNNARNPQRPEIKPPVFSGKDKECITEWIVKFDGVATHNDWNNNKEVNGHCHLILVRK